jgi:aryl-alcohol dehydrogenase-like predicted oxidoreductase
MVESDVQIALGTAQWGMPYGIANDSGMPSDVELQRIIMAALASGVKTLDTARAYGMAEERIGAMLRTTGHADDFRIVTKTVPDLGDPDDPAVAVERLHASVDDSLRLLQPAKIHTLLLHRGLHRTMMDGLLWDEMKALRECEVVTRIGISARSPMEAISALDDPDIDVIQVAGSLLDQRLARRGFFERARERAIEIHLRSIYLQGLAFLSIDQLPEHLNPCVDALAQIERLAVRRGIRAIDLWLDYARSLPVSKIVIGAETADQFRQNVERFRSAAVPEVLDLAASLSDLPDPVLDPAQWPK